MEALLEMRRSAKEKELEAMLSGEHDSCSCFIEVFLVSVFQLLFSTIHYPCNFLNQIPLTWNPVTGVQLFHHLPTSYLSLSWI